MADFVDVYGCPLKLVSFLKEDTGFMDTDFVGQPLVTTPTTEVKALSFKAGQQTSYEKARYDLSLYVVEGSGTLALGYEDVDMTKSSVVVVPKGMLWGINNTGGSSLVVLQTVNKNV